MSPNLGDILPNQTKKILYALLDTLVIPFKLNFAKLLIIFIIFSERSDLSECEKCQVWI